MYTEEASDMQLLCQYGIVAKEAAANVFNEAGVVVKNSNKQSKHNKPYNIYKTTTLTIVIIIMTMIIVTMILSIIIHIVIMTISIMIIMMIMIIVITRPASWCPPGRCAAARSTRRPRPTRN